MARYCVTRSAPCKHVCNDCIEMTTVAERKLSLSPSSLDIDAKAVFVNNDMSLNSVFVVFRLPRKIYDKCMACIGFT